MSVINNPDTKNNSEKCTLRLADLIPYLNRYAVWSLEITYNPITSDGIMPPIILEFEKSLVLIQKPVELRDLSFSFVACSWAQLIVFMQHVYISGNQYPTPLTNAEVYGDIKDAKLNTTSRRD